MKSMFYDTPTQVEFAEFDLQDETNFGIAFRDFIICGCCGGVIPLDEVNVVREFYWVSLEDAIHRI